MRPSLLKFSLLSLLSSGALAHTWLDQLTAIGPDGKYVGQNGYPRDFHERGAPGFDAAVNNFLVPNVDDRITEASPLCRPSQQNPKQNNGFPRLKVPPGQWIAMKYAENGHVSLRDNNIGKPEGGGTVFVFGTTQPKTDEKIVEVMRWTKDGSGGDKRGKLLAANNYDDGRCYQLNNSPVAIARQEAAAARDGSNIAPHEQFCETDVLMPTDAQVGTTMTLYWVWQWPTLPGIDPNIPRGKDEYYTTCSDVDIVAEKPQGAPKNPMIQQDPQTAAVSAYKNRKALTTDPLKDYTFARTAPAATTPPGFAVPTAPVASTTLATRPSSVPAVSSDPAVLPTTTLSPASSQSQEYTTMVVTLVETITLPRPQATGSVQKRDVIEPEDELVHAQPIREDIVRHAQRRHAMRFYG
ncbi:hypothetical protein M501DRAFT_1015032 [Patellaria atrata CBS 101060]|uniref:DUF7492 domain-containing protein n=1 Tax=Patellaria atrata CBS 101060 TaxID=1346257 RepID=A0A9P4VPN9_9PEZI|nr:hypothetical protein M501DRAFT_1015032 [Patellaria atrata CBS 101060]